LVFGYDKTSLHNEYVIKQPISNIDGALIKVAPHVDFATLSLKNIIGNMLFIDLDVIYNHILDGLLPMKTTLEGWKGA